jgi:prephenate dehydrogenase
MTVIGVGHIGGSLALAARETGMITRVIGVDNNTVNLEKALDLKIIDAAMTLEKAIPISDIVALAIPVNAIQSLLPGVLDLVTNQTVIDVGSTKINIIKSVTHHPKRKNYVAVHPMAGTEFSGPEAALADLFKDKTCVLINTEESDPERVKAVEDLFNAMATKLVYLDAESHDLHVAYVSHISHISSFALALTVLAKEKDENRIFELASGGFGSTVRLAKSSPDMWIPIFEQNRDNVLDVLDEHIHTLSIFRSLLIKKDFKKFRHLIEEANQIKKILKT